MLNVNKVLHWADRQWCRLLRMLDSFGDFLFKIVKCRFGLGQFCCLQVSNEWPFSWDYMEP